MVILLEPNPKSIGERLRVYRCRKHMSRKELAECVNVTAATIGNYENDVTTPDINRLIELANALDVTVSMLMHGLEQEREFEPLITDGNPQS